MPGEDPQSPQLRQAEAKPNKADLRLVLDRLGVVLDRLVLRGEFSGRSIADAASALETLNQPYRSHKARYYIRLLWQEWNALDLSAVVANHGKLVGKRRVKRRLERLLLKAMRQVHLAELGR